MPLDECQHPGCPVMTQGEYCRTHRRARRPRRRQSTALNTRPKGRHWTKLREAALKRDGYQCRAELPSGERCSTADLRLLKVHHIQGLKEGGSNTLGNLVTLCKLHHDAIEAAKRRQAAGSRSRP